VIHAAKDYVIGVFSVVHGTYIECECDWESQGKGVKVRWDKRGAKNEHRK